MLGEGISVGNGETVGEGISWAGAGLGTARTISINTNGTAARRLRTTRYYPSSPSRRPVALGHPFELRIRDGVDDVSRTDDRSNVPI
jgi:hypothetical protein